MAEYKLLDSGNGQKLEQVGDYLLVRPAANAFWNPELPESEWNRAAGSFVRKGSSGNWRWRSNPPESWNASLNGINFKVKPTDFGHLGIFPEQSANWQWQQEQIRKTGNVRVLNLFAYSGLGSLSMAKAGAQVCHLDAARGMVEWARENHALNPDIPDSVRWIVDDAVKFINREIRRERKYQGIVLDPPSFGRGAQGQVWKIEEDLGSMLSGCRELLAPGKPAFVLLSCHSPGFTPLVLGRILLNVFGDEFKLETGEMTIPESTGRMLPAGAYARISK